MKGRMGTAIKSVNSLDKIFNYNILTDDNIALIRVKLILYWWPCTKMLVFQSIPECELQKKLTGVKL